MLDMINNGVLPAAAEDLRNYHDTGLGGVRVLSSHDLSALRWSGHSCPALLTLSLSPLAYLPTHSLTDPLPFLWVQSRSDTYMALADATAELQEAQDNWPNKDELSNAQCVKPFIIVPGSLDPQTEVHPLPPPLSLSIFLDPLSFALSAATVAVIGVAVCRGRSAHRLT